MHDRYYTNMQCTIIIHRYYRMLIVLILVAHSLECTTQAYPIGVLLCGQEQEEP